MPLHEGAMLDLLPWLISMAVLIVSYFLNVIYAVSEKLEWVGYFSLSHYWDYNDVLYDGVFTYWEVGLLVAIWLGLAVLVVYLFNKEDIPT